MGIFTRRFVAAAVLALITSQAAWAGARPPHPLLRVEAERFEAMVRGDVAALAPLLANELVYIHSNGIRETKKQFLDALRSGDIRYLSIRPLESEVRDRGDWAMIVGVVELRGALRNRPPVDLRLLYSSVYRRVGDRWQLVLWQTTRAPAAS